MIARLNSDNYYLVNIILNLFENRFLPDWEDQIVLSGLLRSTNIYIANRIYHYLLNLPDQSPALKKQLIRYGKRAL